MLRVCHFGKGMGPEKKDGVDCIFQKGKPFGMFNFAASAASDNTPHSEL